MENITSQLVCRYLFSWHYIIWYLIDSVCLESHRMGYYITYHAMAHSPSPSPSPFAVSMILSQKQSSYPASCVLIRSKWYMKTIVIAENIEKRTNFLINFKIYVFRTIWICRKQQAISHILLKDTLYWKYWKYKPSGRLINKLSIIFIYRFFNSNQMYV